MSSFFDSKQEYQNFINWRNRWGIPTTNNDEVLTAIKRYKADACLRGKREIFHGKTDARLRDIQNIVQLMDSASIKIQSDI